MKDYREMAESAIAEIKKQKAIRKKRIRTVSYFVACFCLICVLPLSLWMGGMFKGDEDGTQTPETGFESNIHIQAPETENTIPPIEEPAVIWADNTEYVIGGGELIGRQPGISDYYTDYDDDTLLAWVVYRNAAYLYFTEAEHIARDEYQNQYTLDRQSIINRIVSETGMSEHEAMARIFDDSEYQKLEKEYNEKIFNDVYTKVMDRIYEDNKAKIESLKNCGITVEYDASQDEHKGYLYHFSGFCVISASRNQIKEYLTQSGEKLSFFPAVSGAEYCTDFYTSERINLPEGQKLTVEAKEAFEKSGNEKIEVQIYIAYRNGKTYTREELEAEALRQMGLTYDQLMNSNDGDLIQQFIELKRYVDSDSAYVDALRERVLKDDEYMSDLPWSKIYYANITYERALEIIESDEIAYITLSYGALEKLKSPLQKNIDGFNYKGILE